MSATCLGFVSLLLLVAARAQAPGCRGRPAVSVLVHGLRIVTVGGWDSAVTPARGVTRAGRQVGDKPQRCRAGDVAWCKVAFCPELRGAAMGPQKLWLCWDAQLGKQTHGRPLQGTFNEWDVPTNCLDCARLCAQNQASRPMAPGSAQESLLLLPLR